MSHIFFETPKTSICYCFICLPNFLCLCPYISRV
ncbi:hypothetical protein ACJIZ3_014985 [Penstemon smallii]|uniref:Uncharacterized protein n=1 Tax=Penstemon smallii TaxID=265156 RepID=A0ABD3RL71_9LAMI